MVAATVPMAVVWVLNSPPSAAWQALNIFRRGATRAGCIFTRR